MLSPQLVHKLELIEGAGPKKLRMRRVPFAYREKVKKEIERLLKKGIIERVEYSDWASPIVVEKKPNNKIRICADFSTGLNDCLKDGNYPLPTSEFIFSRLNNDKVFSKLIYRWK